MNRIKQLRKENEWTQLELSQKLNCALSSIAMYEKGERKPSLEILIRLSEIFNCSIDYLLCKSDIRNLNEINLTAEEIDFAKKVKPLSKQNKELLQNMIETLNKNNN